MAGIVVTPGGSSLNATAWHYGIYFSSRQHSQRFRDMNSNLDISLLVFEETKSCKSQHNSHYSSTNVNMKEVIHYSIEGDWKVSNGNHYAEYGLSFVMKLGSEWIQGLVDVVETHEILEWELDHFPDNTHHWAMAQSSLLISELTRIYWKLVVQRSQMNCQRIEQVILFIMFAIININSGK
jgi:hypothetical protein